MLPPELQRYEETIWCDTLGVELFEWFVQNHVRIRTSSVSPELLQGFARSLALVANWRNITLLSINMKAAWQANFLKSHEQANQCNNFGEKEEVYFFLLPLIYEKWILVYKFNITNSMLVVLYSNCSQIIFSLTLQKLSLHLYLRSPENDRT